jgi:uncharacterized protein
MKTRRTEDGFLIVLDIGDEIMASLRQFAKSERIGLAALTGIGAVRRATLGYLDVEQKQYEKRQFGDDSVELLSLIGNLSTLDGEPFPHCHVVLGDREMRTFGGHLFEAYVSAAAEIFLRIFEGEVARQLNPQCGINALAL